MSRSLRFFRDFRKIKKCRRLQIPPPVVLFPVIWVTHRCNLRCRMCDWWKTQSADTSKELSTWEWYSFFDSVNRMRAATIVITGGEPLLRQDLFDIIKYIRTKGMSCHLCTNGSMLTEVNANKLKVAGLASISVSLYSYGAEIHNRLRGTDCFDAAIKGIKFLTQSAPEIKVGINYVITKENFHNLDRMVAFAQNLKVNQIKFDPVHTNLVHRHKPLCSFTGLLFDNNDLAELSFEIKKLINTASQVKLVANSRTFMNGIIDFFAGRPNRLSCYAGYISCAVDAFGRVSPCDNFEGSENIRDKPFEEIWRSDSFQQLRERVHGCSNRCWDTTHAELNIRCANGAFIREFGQILKDLSFYL
ncbi:MAG: radical SAM protein [Candidatus Omnitrophica bacterium]|nr:radical SAM protein [Candidatus Omnitrophota bacterium]